MSTSSNEKKDYVVVDKTRSKGSSSFSSSGLEQFRPEKIYRTPTRSQPYITGLRGVLVLQSLIWIYFQTFIPKLVYPRATGPQYQTVIRDVFSTLIWNPTLISNGFILLSMRSIPITFLGGPTPHTLAGSVIRRIFRFGMMLSVAAGLGILITSQLGGGYIDKFKTQLPNEVIKTPEMPAHGGAAINSIFNVFFITKDFTWQAANVFWPSGTFWVPSLIFYQSWTVYFIMVVLPYTRAAWNFQGLFAFGFFSFWYASWGWYSVTGLFLADLVVNEKLHEWVHEGLPMSNGYKFPTWIFAVVMLAAGVALKYIFTVFPQHKNALLYLHPFLDLSQNTSREDVAVQGAYARLDDWFVIVAILLLVELLDPLKKILSAKPLVWLGERSFSFFTAQSIIVYAAGIKIWLALHNNGSGMSGAAANAVVLVTCLPLIIIAAEIFHRLVELPSRWLARRGFLWLLEA